MGSVFLCMRICALGRIVVNLKDTTNTICMKKFLLFAVLLTLLLSGRAMAWGNRGHSTVAFIADRHLTERARNNIQSYIHGHSIVYVASWMDYNRTTPPYDITNGWHVDYWTDADRKDKDGNALSPLSTSNIKRLREELKDFRSLDDSTVVMGIRLLTHMVGDMHCPVHVEFPVNRKMTVKVNGSKFKYHRMWDGYILDIKHPNVSPSELAAMLDILSPEESAKRTEGTVDDWYAETVAAANEGIAMIPKDKECTMASYFNRADEIVKRQTLNAGLRLARVLNEIFDK